jgi:hypothetical protein
MWQGDGVEGGLFRIQRTDSAATSDGTLSLVVPRTDCMAVTYVRALGTTIYAVCIQRPCNDTYCGSAVLIPEGAPMRLLSGSNCFSPTSISVHERTKEVWIGERTGATPIRRGDTGSLLRCSLLIFCLSRVSSVRCSSFLRAVLFQAARTPSFSLVRF